MCLKAQRQLEEEDENSNASRSQSQGPRAPQGESPWSHPAHGTPAPLTGHRGMIYSSIFQSVSCLFECIHCGGLVTLSKIKTQNHPIIQDHECTQAEDTQRDYAEWRKSRSQRLTYCTIPSTQPPPSDKRTVTENRSVVARGQGWRKDVIIRG